MSVVDTTGMFMHAVDWLVSRGYGEVTKAEDGRCLSLLWDAWPLSFLDPSEASIF